MFFRKKGPAVPRVSDSPSPPRLSVAATPSSASVIGRNTRFRGEVRGRGPLIIRGQVEGDVGIEERLTVDVGGLLDAVVRANDVVVAGEARGNLQAEGTLILRSTGVAEGRMSAGGMRVEEGAILKGTLSRGSTRT